MLDVRDIYIKYGDRVLMDHISFTAGPGEKIGLAGRNGAGKSTLLKVIAGEVTPDKGKLRMPNDFTIGYLHQDIVLSEDRTVMDEALTAFDHIRQIEQQLKDVEHQLETRSDYESAAYTRLIEEMTHLNDRLAHFGDLSQARARAERVLKGLGFSADSLQKPVALLSGGWKMRVELAKILLRRPDVLLLDEPTNHLDIEAIIWFESYLKDFAGTVLLISHDVRLLDNVTNRTLELELGKLYDYKAGYTKYLSLREERRQQLRAAWVNQQKVIKEKERVIERFRAKANKAKMAQSMMKQLQRMEKIELDDVSVKSMRVRFPEPPRSGDDVLFVEQVSMHFGHLKVFDDVHFDVKRGEKIAFVGQNGRGKTTLARIIAGELEPTAGRVRIGHNVHIGYFAQDQDRILDKDLTLLQTLEAASPPEMRPRLRALLGAFLFSGDEVDKKVAVLSGGERMRLSLAVLMLHPANLLILDEPTNHLDVISKQVLKQALADYTGTLILVSHDRDFLDGLTERTIEFRDGRIKEYLGDINYFLEKRRTEDFRQIEQSYPQLRPKDRKPVRDSRQQQKLERTIKQIEKKIAALETETGDLENQIAAPDFYARPDAQKVLDRHAELKAQLQRAMADWEDAVSKL